MIRCAVPSGSRYSIHSGRKREGEIIDPAQTPFNRSQSSTGGSTCSAGFGGNMPSVGPA